MKIEHDEKITKMRNGEKIKCPRCEDGFFSAAGDPKTTKVFKCDKCSAYMTLTIPYKRNK